MAIYIGMGQLSTPPKARLGKKLAKAARALTMT
jgi:hypothetical protein